METKARSCDFWLLLHRYYYYSLLQCEYRNAPILEDLLKEDKKGLYLHHIYHNNIIRCLRLNCRKRAYATIRIHAGNISGIYKLLKY